jgi:hypothetical protein
MTNLEPDTRSESRKQLDERLAAEPPKPAVDVAGVVPKPMETHGGRTRRPVAIVGVVENGLIRPLDPNVSLPERSRVIIVAQDAV